MAEQFPQFEAQFEPVERLGRARLHFRPEGSRYWYSVAMAREGDRFRAVVPKPRSSLKGFSYYIEATDVDFAASRTVGESGRVSGSLTARAVGLPGSSTSSHLPSRRPPRPPRRRPRSMPLEWWPARADGLTGRWVGTSPDGAVDTAGSCAGQQIDLLFVVTQTGSNLAGTYDGTVRVAGPPGCPPPGTPETGTLAGTVGAGTLSLTVTVTQPPGIKPAAATGTFTANRMSGTFQNVGGNGAGTWSINRQ